MNEASHIPVLLAEVIQALNVKPDAVVVDATYGRGGHAGEIMKQLSGSGRLIALDRDPQAIADARRRFAGESRVQVEQSRFSQIGRVCDRLALSGRVDGILFDFGVSSPQLDDAARGFSFRNAGPLDMRMDPSTGESAADWVNRADEVDIANVIFEYGEERHSRRIARAIVRARAQAPITDTLTLAKLVAAAVPGRERKKDPATRTFQAIRLYINRELDEIDAALPEALRVLAPAGRLAVISFHSLEDRRVKNFIRNEANGPEIPRGMPAPPVPFRPRLRALGRAIRASDTEVARNPRARSAVLRVAERTEVAHA
ncbi:MAG: 16S rRNA (cytosine(1402)-N(4))-methyltransferase RsmH [Gammaproteobacteria bacterium]|nr:16S rRNA (cytosine(1402)-N(4))-methyltransferase RsmH [Gammaproteobacteria bacterium]